MWDRRYMGEKRDVDASEPDLLISVGDRLPTRARRAGTRPLAARSAAALSTSGTPYEWVRLLLKGSPSLAARKASHVQAAGFPMWLTRDLEAAKDYTRLRYSGEPAARFGLMVSSQADRGHTRRGLDVSFHTMARLNDRIGRWFNAEPDDPASCCQLEQSVTEFQVQGLEVDLPIVVWGRGPPRVRPRLELQPETSPITRRGT